MKEDDRTTASCSISLVYQHGWKRCPYSLKSDAHHSIFSGITLMRWQLNREMARNKAVIPKLCGSLTLKAKIPNTTVR